MQTLQILLYLLKTVMKIVIDPKMFVQHLLKADVQVGLWP